MSHTLVSGGGLQKLLQKLSYLVRGQPVDFSGTLFGSSFLTPAGATDNEKLFVDPEYVKAHPVTVERFAELGWKLRSPEELSSVKKTLQVCRLYH